MQNTGTIQEQVGQIRLCFQNLKKRLIVPELLEEKNMENES